MAFVPDKPNSRFVADQPISRFVPDNPSEVSLSKRKTAPAYGGKEGLKRLAFGGPSGYFSASGSEDVLPLVGQTVGSSVGGYGGSVAGATAGQGARQAIKSIRGTRDSQPRKLFGIGPKAPGIINDLAGEAAGTATIEGLFRGAGKVAPKISNRMMLSVLKPGRDVIKRNPNLGIEALEAGITGTKSGMISKAEDLISGGEDALSNALKGNRGTVNPRQIARGLGAIKRPFKNVGDQASVDAVKEVQRNLRGKGNLGLEEANQLKRDLYRVIKDTSFGKGVGEIASKQSARKQAARGLKEAIEGVAPEVKGINKKIGIAVTAKDALENALANQQKTVLLQKLAGMGAGGLALTGNIPAVLGVLAGDAGVHYLRSAPFVTGTAKNLLRARKFGKPVSIATTEGARMLFGQRS